MARPHLKIVHSMSSSHAGPKPHVWARLTLEDFVIFDHSERYGSRQAANKAAADFETKAQHFAFLIEQDLEVEEYENVPTYEQRRLR